jgi:hypothetical protein
VKVQKEEGWHNPINKVTDSLDIIHHPVFFYLKQCFETSLHLLPQVNSLLSWNQLTELVPNSGPISLGLGIGTSSIEWAQLNRLFT